jgi:hypothetical protein
MSSSVNLVQIYNGAPMASAFAFQPPGSRGFAFYGVADGEYELVGQSSAGPGETSLSEPRRITVKGADVSGIELVVKPLGAIAGRFNLQKSEAPECKNKREPLFSETLIFARRNEKPGTQRATSFGGGQGSPTKDGAFQLRNLAAGQYNLSTRFFARYWYLRSISRDVPNLAPGATKRVVDLARDGINVKSGDRLKDIIVTLGEGAGSLRGILKPSGDAIPPNLYVHLVPAEKENADDVLRFFADAVPGDGSFALSNIPPGRYWVVARVAATGETRLETMVRQSGETELRARIRKAAEAAKTEIEFKPCQNVVDYQMALKPN